MGPLSDQSLRELLLDDPRRGWRVFVEQYTPTLLALIEQDGIYDRDEAMELYIRACEHLSSNGCVRLRRWDPAKGPLAAWLAVVIRNVIVDWVRSRAGRRRLFASIESLAPLDREIFELYYWHERSPSEIAEMARGSDGRALGLSGTLDALDRIERVLADRQRSDLLSLAARSHAPASLESQSGELAIDVADPSADPEVAARVRQTRAAFESALGALPDEDALIVSLRFVDGLSVEQVRAALHLDRLAPERVRGILDRLRSFLEGRGITATDVRIVDMAVLERGAE